MDFRIADDVVTTTADHSFWNATGRQWEGPEDFDAGDRALAADGDVLVTRGRVAHSWVKMEQDVDGVNIHYVWQQGTDNYDHFKFVDGVG